MLIRRILFVLLIVCALDGYSQSEVVNIGGITTVNLTNKVPDLLTSERSIVIINQPAILKSGFDIRADWKKLADKTHKVFRKIGIDPIAYVYQDDINAGPEVYNAYKNIFNSRSVKNIVLVQQVGEYPRESFKILVTEYAPETFVKKDQAAWQESGRDLEEVMVKLGRQVLRQDIARSNFLIPELPDYLGDLQIFTGTRYETYPSRVRSVKLAVVAFQKVKTEDSSNASIEEYNRMIDAKNEKLVSILAKYPYQYELVSESDEDKLYKAGFQYALLPISSSARSVRELLQYPTTANETQYMTNVNRDGKNELLRIPTNANVTKYYIKQTVVKDIHLGKIWDADTSWEKALDNFLFNLMKSLE